MRELLAGNQGNVNHYVFPPKVRSRLADGLLLPFPRPVLGIGMKNPTHAADDP